MDRALALFFSWLFSVGKGTILVISEERIQKLCSEDACIRLERRMWRIWILCDIIRVTFAMSCSHIESILKACHLIEHVCIVQRPDRSFTVALIEPNPTGMQFLRASNPAVKDDKEFSDLFLKSIRDYGLRAGLAESELPVKMKLVRESWTSKGLVRDNNMIDREEICEFYHFTLSRLFSEDWLNTDWFVFYWFSREISSNQHITL